MEVLKKELKQMIDKQVWIPVNDNHMTSEERRQVIRCSVFLKEKFRADGSFDRDPDLFVNHLLPLLLQDFHCRGFSE